MPIKILRRSRMASPKNVIVPLIEPEDTVTLTYKMTVSKKDFAQDDYDPAWKDKVWNSLKSMQNLDDEVVITPGKSMNAAIEAFAEVSPKKVYTAFLGEALTQAMLSKAYTNQT